MAIYFEEASALQAERNADIERKSRGGGRSRNDDGMDVDDVLGGPDEIDYFEAKKRGLI